MSFLINKITGKSITNFYDKLVDSPTKAKLLNQIQKTKVVAGKEIDFTSDERGRLLDPNTRTRTYGTCQ